MTARDILSRTSPSAVPVPVASVDSSMPVIDVIPRLLDAPGRVLGVTEGGTMLGLIDAGSALAGVAAMFPARDDCSIVEVECAPGDYSASLLTHAAEDADIHVVGLWTAPAERGRIHATLRLRCEDPAHAVRNLERYGYDVVASYGHADSALELASRRLRELQLYLSM